MHLFAQCVCLSDQIRAHLRKQISVVQSYLVFLDAVICDAVTKAIEPAILDDAEVATQAVWLIDGYEPTEAAKGVFAAAAANSVPYPMVPYQGLLHSALGAELSDFMQGKESSEQALAGVEAAYTAAAKEQGFLN